jgi:hypothetical protein
VAHDRWLEAVNDLAAARGEMFIRRVETRFKYSPNDPPLLLMHSSPTCLYLRPWGFDDDQDPIRITFDRCVAATFSPPNDENTRLSPLNALGFGWWDPVTVGNSPWATLFPWAEAELSHYVLLVKDCCFHALARGFTECRVPKYDFAPMMQALHAVPWEQVGISVRGVALYPGKPK